MKSLSIKYWTLRATTVRQRSRHANARVRFPRRFAYSLTASLLRVSYLYLPFASKKHARASMKTWHRTVCTVSDFADSPAFSRNVYKGNRIANSFSNIFFFVARICFLWRLNGSHTFLYRMCCTVSRAYNVELVFADSEVAYEHM